MILFIRFFSALLDASTKSFINFFDSAICCSSRLCLLCITDARLVDDDISDGLWAWAIETKVSSIKFVARSSNDGAIGVIQVDVEEFGIDNAGVELFSESSESIDDIAVEVVASSSFGSPDEVMLSVSFKPVSSESCVPSFTGVVFRLLERTGPRNSVKLSSSVAMLKGLTSGVGDSGLVWKRSTSSD